MSAELEGRLALVTGGSRGIGKAIAGELSRAGAQVVLTSRSETPAREVAAEISAKGLQATGIALDVSSDESVERGIAAILEDYGRIAILVNNAGITRDNLLLRMKKEDWDQVLQTNLTGVYRLCRAVVPSMLRARFGRIVNISSVVAGAGSAGQSNYAAAKAGLEGFTRSLARELASRNIMVNSVAPGFIETDMTRELDDKTRRLLLNQVPLKRFGTPEDVSAVVRYLAGPDADYITGVTLHVNGGMYM